MRSSLCLHCPLPPEKFKRAFFAAIVNWTNSVDLPRISAVPNPIKGAGQNSPAKNPPFEEALKQLEAVVETMEADDLPLETLLAKYEEGAKLVKICQEKLAEAEVKISQLEKTAAGEMKLKPVALTEE
jgi:exodeoxyribonuclease VII small subunit